MVLVIIAEYIHIIVYSSELTRQDELVTLTSNTIQWIVYQTCNCHLKNVWINIFRWTKWLGQM